MSISAAEVARQKVARLRAGRMPRVLDLFAGCGGLSLGFLKAGFEIVGAVESDVIAVQTHARNFHRGDPRHSAAFDITKTSPEKLADALGLGDPSSSVDVIVGGPPCQAFARVGRAKLREIDEHPEAFRHDPRATLYRSYLNYVESFRPIALLMENVPDVLNHGGQNIPQEVADLLASKGYDCRYTLLNSVFYGVPQMRERMFLVAYRKELGPIMNWFPQSTHTYRLPPGYEGSRSVALKLVGDLLGRHHDYEHPPFKEEGLLPAVTAYEAIGDLPVIDARAQLKDGTLKRGARHFDRPTMKYDKRRKVSRYAGKMKNWLGYNAPAEGLYDHQIRYLPRDYELFALMREGAEYPELHKMAIDRFEKRAQTLRISKSSKAWLQLQKEMVPPYDAGKFPNKWWKLRADAPARTLMAHLGKDSYSHIHYDSLQARTISVREAARLQSFPDGFLFCGTMNPAFRQIGNSVPPLLAAAIATQILQNLLAAISKSPAQVDTVIAAAE